MLRSEHTFQAYEYCVGMNPNLLGRVWLLRVKRFIYFSRKNSQENMRAIFIVKRPHKYLRVDQWRKRFMQLLQAKVQSFAMLSLQFQTKDNSFVPDWSTYEPCRNLYIWHPRSNQYSLLLRRPKPEVVFNLFSRHIIPEFISTFKSIGYIKCRTILQSHSSNVL